MPNLRKSDFAAITPRSLSLLSIDRLLGLCDFKTKTDAPEGSIGFLLTFCNIYEPLSTFSSKCGNGLFFCPFIRPTPRNSRLPAQAAHHAEISRDVFQKCWPTHQGSPALFGSYHKNFLTRSTSWNHTVLLPRLRTLDITFCTVPANFELSLNKPCDSGERSAHFMKML